MMKEIKKIRNDIILALAIIFIAISVFAVFRLTMRDGAYVSVSFNGTVMESYPLSQNINVKLNYGDGEQYNILVIEDGEAYIEDASCPDGICVQHRAIKYKGESIVCLPNKIVLTVEGEASAPSVDAVS